MGTMPEAISRPSALELADRDEISADGRSAKHSSRDMSPLNIRDRNQHPREEFSTDAKPSYSIFTKHEKLAMVLLAAFAATFSPLSSNLYFPALTAISRDLHTSLSKVNITVTSYMIVSAFAPMIFCSVADQLGRRPVYIFMFLTYSLACLGLALQRSYPALLILRMLQSVGGSATLGLGYGIVGDLVESSDRGTFIGILCAGPNVAPTVGPMLGGLITQMAGWQWTFGFLASFGCLTLLSIVVVLPETARNVVGDGSLPVSYWNRCLLWIWLEKRRKRSNPKKLTKSTNRVSWKAN